MINQNRHETKSWYEGGEAKEGEAKEAWCGTVGEGIARIAEGREKKGKNIIVQTLTSRGKSGYQCPQRRQNNMMRR